MVTEGKDLVFDEVAWIGIPPHFLKCFLHLISGKNVTKTWCVLVTRSVVRHGLFVMKLTVVGSLFATRFTTPCFPSAILTSVLFLSPYYQKVI
jgi:hypothetical protein